ncbi:MAG: hypothetical protein ACKO9Q_30785, partial [Pirellula sp.]
MRLAPVGNESLSLDALKLLLDRNNSELTQEVVRSLAMRKDQDSHKVLSQIVKNEAANDSMLVGCVLYASAMSNIVAWCSSSGPQQCQSPVWSMGAPEETLLHATLPGTASVQQ